MAREGGARRDGFGVVDRRGDDDDGRGGVRVRGAPRRGIGGGDRVRRADVRREALRERMRNPIRNRGRAPRM